MLILTRKWVSNLGALYLKSPLSKKRINKMVNKHKINLNEYEECEYGSFNEFFIRKKKKHLMKIPKEASKFLSPADSRLTVYKIDENLCLNIKDSKYTISELLQDEKLAKKYNNGYCFVYRLCVDDYHRYYYVDDAVLMSSKKINGVFHTVQPIAFKKYKVFSENTREYSVLKTSNFGDIIQIEVGALMVGKICNRKAKKVKRGDEKGHFEFGGSTIVILVEKDKVKVDNDILEASEKDIETKVSLFETVGRRL